jgi:hypothetical protein
VPSKSSLEFLPRHFAISG